jgi:hypothetical protein
MSNPADTAHTELQLQQARELMAQGRPEKALAVALVALQQTMTHLRDALGNLQNHLSRLTASRPQAKNTRTAPQPDPWPALTHKPRYLH